MVRGEVGMLRGEEGFGVRGDVLMMVGEVRRERLGAAEGSVGLRRAGHKWRLVIRLRLRGDVGLVRRMQVKLAYVNRVGRGLLTEVRVQGLGLRGVSGTRGEEWRSVRKMGVWQEMGERRGKHVGEVRRRWEMLGRVLLHVHSLPPGVWRRVHLRIHGRPGVRAASPFLLERPRVRWRSSYRVCPCVGVQALRGLRVYIHGG